MGDLEREARQLRRADEGQGGLTTEVAFGAETAWIEGRIIAVGE
jgi:hypothetical protein